MDRVQHALSSVQNVSDPVEVAARDNLSAYDATYVALAEALGASLLTTDRRLNQCRVHPDGSRDVFGASRSVIRPFLTLKQKDASKIGSG